MCRLLGGAGNPWPQPPPRYALFFLVSLATCALACQQFASGNTGTSVLVGATSVTLMYLSGLNLPRVQW